MPCGSVIRSDGKAACQLVGDPASRSRYEHTHCTLRCVPHRLPYAKEVLLSPFWSSASSSPFSIWRASTAAAHGICKIVAHEIATYSSKFTRVQVLYLSKDTTVLVAYGHTKFRILSSYLCIHGCMNEPLNLATTTSLGFLKININM